MDSTGQFHAAMRGRLYSIGEVLVVVEHHSKIKQRSAGYEDLPRDHVIDNRKCQRAQTPPQGIRKARVVYGANSCRKLPAHRGMQHPCEARFECVLNLSKPSQHLGDRSSGSLHNTGCTERVISSRADNEMRCIHRQLVQLAKDTGSDSATQSQARDLPCLRNDNLELLCHLEATADVGCVV